MNINEAIKEMQKDIGNLKLKSFQPDKVRAKIFKDYLSWENGNPKKNFVIFKKCFLARSC